MRSQKSMITMSKIYKFWIDNQRITPCHCDCCDKLSRCFKLTLAIYDIIDSTPIRYDDYECCFECLTILSLMDNVPLRISDRTTIHINNTQTVNEDLEKTLRLFFQKDKNNE